MTSVNSAFPRFIPALCSKGPLAVLVLAAAVGACASADDVPAVELAEERVAILPFDNGTGDAALDALAVRAAEAAEKWISQVEPADLAAVGMSAGIEGDDRALRLAELTGAALIVRGTVVAAGPDVEVRAQIVDGATGTVVHDLPAERAPAADPSSALDRIGSRIAGAIAIHNDPNWVAPELSTAPTLEAYRLSREAASAFTQSDYERALPLNRQAYETDTMWVAVLGGAWASLRNLGRVAEAAEVVGFVEARRHVLTPYERHWQDWRVALTDNDHEAALQATVAAAQMSPLDATYAVGLMANRTGRWRMAAEHLSRREELSNEWSEGWGPWRYQLMVALHALGDHTRELAEARAARAAFPDEPGWIWNEARARAALGEAEAVRVLVDSAAILLADQPNYNHYENVEDIAVELKGHGRPEAGNALLEQVIAHYRAETNPVQLADALGFAGRASEAYEALEPVIADATTPDPIGWFGVAAAMSGQNAKAEEALRRLEARPEQNATVLRYQAAIHGALGRCDRAVELYRGALAAGLTYIAAWGGEWWHRDWETQPVRDDCPGFEALLADRSG